MILTYCIQPLYFLTTRALYFLYMILAFCVLPELSVIMFICILYSFLSVWIIICRIYHFSCIFSSSSLSQIVLLLRLVPLLPFNMLNYLLSVTPVSLGEYALASWLGMMVHFYFSSFGVLMQKLLLSLTSTWSLLNEIKNT